MPHRIALASHDGKFIDTHFGHAERFAIVDLFPERYELVELRPVKRACGEGGHDEGAFDAILNTLSDCEALLVERIGYGAAQYVASKGIRVFEAPYPIDDVLKKLIAGGTLDKP
jgi:nitrogen fixation protein NifX